MCNPTNRAAHTMTFVRPVVEHWLEREIAHNSRLYIWLPECGLFLRFLCYTMVSFSYYITKMVQIDK